MGVKFTSTSGNTGVAYLFPGQGSQNVGMGKQLYDSSPAARLLFNEVDKVLDRPLTKLMFSGPEEELRETVNAQPAIMAVSLACFKAMEENLGLGSEAMLCPTVLAGHSLGEYTAMAVAGVLDVGQTAYLVQERGRLMQEACDQNSGSMAAILGLDQVIMEEISRETRTYVSNVNTKEQIVISGDRLAVAGALDMALDRGARKVVPLRVAGAFHSVLMEPARAGLVEAINGLEFKDPVVPIVANCTGEPMTKAEDVKKELELQIFSCVQWKKSMDYMVGAGVSKFVEIGPGRTLSSMAKRIDGSVEVLSVGDLDSILRLKRN